MAKFKRSNKRSYQSHDKSSTGDQPQIQFQLGVERRRVTVRKFRKLKLVDIREYYQKDGAWLPGTKGISLTEEQWGVLVSKIADINEALQNIDHEELLAKKESEEKDTDSDEEDDVGEDAAEDDDEQEEDLEGVEFEDVVDERPAKRQRVRR
ncbi:DEKNAAC102442 [Brettanomyces naardenensis]|uniref:DEKNAAC102444 n=1 Tax=Brettanomyces naardenensis TaxID=13370 RepID=A0A448YKQ9_BRENA|nr:DEKNAAC102442 [Brettanomyces naardenensis]